MVHNAAHNPFNIQIPSNISLEVKENKPVIDLTEKADLEVS